MTDSRPAGRLTAITTSLVANAVLLPPATVGAAVLARRWWRARNAREAAARAAARPAPVRTVPLAEFDAAFAPHPVLGPTLDAEVRFIGRGNMHVLGGASDLDSWVLAVLAKRARRMFEFGTCTGKTTYLWAINSPPDAHITTLTLAPDADALVREADDEENANHIALGESVCTTYLYSGTEAEAKVTQLYGDSKAFDDMPYAGACDIVFVDGAHSYSYVMSDTEKALRMVRPGGVVLWHDYIANPDYAPDVFRTVAEVSARLPIMHLEGTAIAAYRHPAA